MGCVVITRGVIASALFTIVCRGYANGQPAAAVVATRKCRINCDEIMSPLND